LHVMLCGQKLEKVGPIERPLKYRSREDPFPLPQGLKWTWLNSEEAMRLDPRKERKKTQWITSYPNFKNHYYWGVVSKQGDAILDSVPDFVNVGGKLFSVMSLEPSSQSIELMRSTSYDDTPLQMASEMLKEVVNSTKKNTFYKQFYGIPCIVKPVVVIAMWHYYLEFPCQNYSVHSPLLQWSSSIH